MRTKSFQDFDSEEMINVMTEMLRLDQEWVPYSDVCSLYMRPTLIGTDVRSEDQGANKPFFFSANPWSRMCYRSKDVRDHRTSRSILFNRVPANQSSCRFPLHSCLPRRSWSLQDGMQLRPNHLGRKGSCQQELPTSPLALRRGWGSHWGRNHEHFLVLEERAGRDGAHHPTTSPRTHPSWSYQRLASWAC